MKAIWKEFFRLKWEEVSEFFSEVIFPIFFVLLLILFAITSLAYFILYFDGEATNKIELGLAMSFLIIPALASFLLVRRILEWLFSNWETAKRNVARIERLKRQAKEELSING